MKLNPFAKKTGAYLASIKTEHDDLQRRIEDIEDELVDARADYEAASDKNTRMREKAGRYSLNTTPEASAHWPVVTAATTQAAQRATGDEARLAKVIEPTKKVKSNKTRSMGSKPSVKGSPR